MNDGVLRWHIAADTGLLETPQWCAGASWRAEPGCLLMYGESWRSSCVQQASKPTRAVEKRSLLPAGGPCHGQHHDACPIALIYIYILIFISLHKALFLSRSQDERGFRKLWCALLPPSSGGGWHQHPKHPPAPEHLCSQCHTTAPPHAHSPSEVSSSFQRQLHLQEATHAFVGTTLCSRGTPRRDLLPPDISSPKTYYKLSCGHTC